MNSLRVFTIGGVLSYRALFNWQSPTYYIPTMLGHPLFQVLFFAYLGRFSHVRNDAFFVVGNSVQVCAMAGVYGMAMTIGGERWTRRSRRSWPRRPTGSRYSSDARCRRS